MKQKYDFLIFIGRFQPAHNAHIEIIHEALKLAKQVIILVGSSFQPRTHKNPFTAEEREKLIRSAFESDKYHCETDLIFRYVSDKLYNDQQWALEVQSHVQDVLEEFGDGLASEMKVGIIGHKKDNSTFYLDMFPQWGDPVEFPNVKDLHATSIRDYYFNDKWNDDDPLSPDVFTEMCKDYLNEGIFNFMLDWRKTETFEYLSGEYSFYENYKAAWKDAPYPPTFVTVDGIVIQSGHVLLVRRRAFPGKGLWAIPGGFLNQGENVEDAVIRELREETKLKVPPAVLKGSIEESKVFDHPHRSLRGRTITHAHLILLNPGPLPPVKGGDDADKARWFSLEEILTMESQLFEDHYSIINYFIGRV